MSNRLSNYTGSKYTFRIGEIAARGSLATALGNNPLKFADNTTFMSGDDLGDIIADYTDKMYISMTPASGSIEADFIGTLNSYWQQRRGDYKNMYAALIAQYDPIQNYKVSESGIDGKRIDDVTDTNTRTGKMTTTDTPTGTTTTTTTPVGGTTTTEVPTGTETDTKTLAGGMTTTSTESRTTYDNTASYKPTVQTVTEEVPNVGNQETNTHSYTNRQTETTEEYIDGTSTTVTESFTNRKTESETSFTNLKDERTIEHENDQSGSVNGNSIENAAEVSEHYFERSGNIGVTTSQQMITSEIELRYLYNLRYMFIREFITRFTF